MTSVPERYPVQFALLQPAEPHRAPSRVGHVLALAGLGIAMIGLFALPVERFRLTLGGRPVTGLQDVAFAQLRSLSRGTDEPSRLARQPLSAFTGFWWHDGLLLAVAALIVLGCALVADIQPRIVGLCTAFVAAGTGIVHGYALAHTTNYPTATGQVLLRGSLFLFAGLGTWVAFAGLTAATIGGVYAAVASALAQRANASSKAATASASACRATGTTPGSDAYPCTAST
jgi:hypothetical protein